MVLRFLRWFAKNLSTLILAFILALVVWVSAETAEDPNQQDRFPSPVPLEVRGQDPSLQIMQSTIPDSVEVRINAPRSVWDYLLRNPSKLNAWIDLTGLGPGEYTVPVHAEAQISRVHIVEVTPSDVDVTLEPLISKTYTVTVNVDGEPALGYRTGQLQVDPHQVVVSGPQSAVSQVTDVIATVDISGLTQTFDSMVGIRAVDARGITVKGVEVTPTTIRVTQPVELLGGYRNVIVKVITTGQLADGYKLTNIAITPPTVVVFSSDPTLVEKLPGYVETEPLDLTGVEDDFETPLSLNLPEGISVVNDQKVLVQVSVAAIESNQAFSLPIEVIGLKPGLSARVAPGTVDIILSGPVPILNTIEPSDIRVVVDLTGKDLGNYTVQPTVSFVPSRLTITSILPANVQVTIIPEPTSTPTAATTETTGTPGTPSGEFTGTPSQAPTETPTPTPGP